MKESERTLLIRASGSLPSSCRSKISLEEEVKNMIQYVFEGTKSRSAAYNDGQLIGLCQYQVDGDRWIITHTEVQPEFGGRGIARELVMMVARKAKEHGFTLVPVCSYAAKVLDQQQQ
ncbi:GNAT family N-acetyltransferase [Dubosiella muris]|nr:GNAT family N-acetyltransferase [Dubosiella muris]